MRVAVTGATGFVGSHVVDRLLADGHEVLGVDDLSGGRLDRLAGARAAGGLRLVRADLTDALAHQELLRYAPDAICHLARTRGDEERELSLATVGTRLLLESARALGGARLVVGTDAVVYGRPRSQPVGVRAGLRPRTPDAAALAAAEVLRQAARDVPSVALVLGRVYGPRQEVGAVARFCAARAQGRPAVVHGPGHVVRDWLYVDDAVDAVVRSLVAPVAGRRLHVAAGRGTSVADLLRAVAAAGDALGLPPAPEPQHQPPLPGEVHHLVLDVATTRAALGWEPFTPLHDGLVATLRALLP